MRAWRGLTLLPAFGAASLTLAHLLTATAFRTKTREIFARLENMAAAEVQAAPVPAIIQIFREARGRPKSGSEGRMAASNWRDARHTESSVATVHR